MKNRLLEQGKTWKIKGVLFDFDGTLTRAGMINFQKIKEDIDCPKDIPVLEFIESMSEGESKKNAIQILEQAEMEAALRAEANEGAIELLLQLKEREIPFGILTRNSHENVFLSLKQFRKIKAEDFTCIVSRDSEARPKPHEEGVLLAAEIMGVKAEELLMTGDYHFDVEAGKRAGALTSFIDNGRAHDDGGADFLVSRLSELVEVIELGTPVRGGKLPNNILEKYLEMISVEDSHLITGPGTGEDTAALEICEEKILTITSDPVTFTTYSAGKLAVTINANDIATSGARPEWFMMTLLMPSGSTPSEAGKIILDADQACKNLHVNICGGHTEFTNAVNRPIVSGVMLGTVKEKNIKLKKNMKEGDLIVMAGATGLEGTAILAYDYEELLQSKGVKAELIEESKKLGDSLSILKAAEVASRYNSCTAMHDVTEGGVATALEEFSSAGGRYLDIDEKAIIILRATRVFCEALGLNAMGLIGSGALLISVGEKDVTSLIGEIECCGMVCRIIGSAGSSGSGVRGVSWPSFYIDELNRIS